MTMAMDLESIREFVAPLVTSLGLDLYDVELTGAGHARSVRVVVDRAVGSEPGGVDLDTIADATRILAPALAASAMLRDSDVLEVSSPGLERALRRPEHFRSAVGSLVSAKHVRDGETVRDRGTIVAVDDDGIELALEREGDPPADLADQPHIRLAFADISACRTIFEWGPAPRPGRGSKPGKGSASRSNGNRPKETSRS
jgi:ribosome maturation factor RimP